MSSAFAISAVTGVLQSLLNGIYVGAGLSSAVLVTARAPDIIQASLGNPTSPQLQVNVFLHQVTLNPAWRNADLPALDADGSTRLGNPPLALDLHYLLTAYGAEDCEAEALLGFGVQFIHEQPILARQQIRNALAALTTLPAAPPSWLLTFLGASGLADQIEMIKITPATLGREELAWLWTALKADYRPTYPFQVTVALIRSQQTLTSGLPVLTRTVTAQPSLAPPLPTLIEVDPPGGQPAACLGDVLTVKGANLGAATGVTVSNARLGVSRSIGTLSSVTGVSFQFAVPPPQATPTDLPAGVYLLSAQTPQGAGVLNTNGLPLAIAPRITSSPATVASGGGVTVTVGCAPFIRVGQQASLLIGGQEAEANPLTAPTNSPSFTFAGLRPTGGPVPIWLQVDGIASPTIDMSKPPPAPPTFLGPFIQVT